jgi:hypothetical protein
MQSYALNFKLKVTDPIVHIQYKTDPIIAARLSDI